MRSHEPIAVIGMSACFPCGEDLRSFWSSVVAARPAFRRIPRERMSQDDYYDADPHTPDKTYVRSAALLHDFDFDPVARRIPAQVYRSADIVHWLALEQAIRAVEDAGYTERTLPRERTGVILGNTATGEISRANAIRLRWPYVARSLRVVGDALQQSPLVVDELIDEYESVFKSAFPDVSEDTLPGLMSNTIAGRVCNHLDLGGGGYTVDGACASSLIAVAHGIEALVSGQLDLVLVGGADVSIDPIELVGFAKMGVLARERMAVYSKDGQGFFPGEGCGWALLKRLADARSAGDYIYAVIHGCGVSSDGRGGLTAPSVSGQKLALTRAYETAPYAIRDVDFIEGHGTGTIIGDRTELAALKSMLQPSARRVGVTALKSIAGHMKAAAGVGSFIKAVLAVNQRVIPPLSGCVRPHDEFNNAPIRPVLDGDVRDPGDRLRAGVSAFGFGGINVHVAIESADPPKRALAPPVPARALLVSTQDSEVFVFEGEDRAELAARLKAHAADAAGLSAGELGDFAAHLAGQVRGQGLWRAAAVAGDAESLDRKLLTLARILEGYGEGPRVQVDPLQDCWVGRRDAPARIGFLFPGQGSQRINTGRVLVERHHWAQEFIARASARFGPLSGRQLEDLLYIREYRGDDEDARQQAMATLADTTISQPAVGVTSLLFVEALRRAGIHPSAVGGHSFGELTAFAVAGAMTQDEFLSLVRVRGEAMAAPPDRAGKMVSLNCDLETASRLCAQARGYAVVANLNSDRQVVVAGGADAVESVAEAAAREGLRPSLLAVSQAFHSDFVAPAAATLGSCGILAETVPGLRIPLFSSIDGRRVQEGDALRAHFARQIVTRVDFAALARAMAHEVDLVVEVGPGAMLCGLLRDIEAARGLLALPVERDAGSHVSFNRVLAASFVHGVDVDFAAVFEGRLVRPYARPADRRFIANPCERDLRLPDRSGLRHGLLSSSLDALVSQRANVSPETLDQYLDARKEFLAAVVEADIRTGSWGDRGAVEPGSGDAAPVRRARQRSLPPPETPPAVAPDLAQSVDDLLLDLVAERTGFPRTSVAMEMKLLNDLSLESIAAGEIIVRAATAAGVGGKIDPAPLLDGTLAQVARAITAAREGRDVTTADPAEDPASLMDTLDQLTGRPAWLRCFAVEHVPQALDAGAAAPPRHIVLSALDADEGRRLALGLADCGARVSVSAGDSLQLPADADCVVIALMPATTVPPTPESVRSRVERILAALPPRSWRGTLVLIEPDRLVRREPFEFALPMASFAASVHFERPDLRVRSIAFDPALDLVHVGKLTAAEASSPERWSSSRIDAAGRRTVPSPKVLTQTGAPRQRTLSAHDVVVVTGGAKGITAELARVLGERTGARLALLGRSSLDGAQADPEVRTTLDRCAAAGVRALYVQCDVTDPESVRRAVAHVGTELGPVTAILHGAGLNRPAPVDRATADDATNTIVVKVLGLVHVLQATDPGQLKLVVGLTSIIGLTGMPGNAWYAAANAGLEAALASWGAAHPSTAVLAVGYSLWAGIGMGVKLDVAQNVKRMGVAAIPPSAGADAFLRLVEHNPGADAVIVASRLGGLDSWRPHVSVPRQNRRFLEDVLAEQPGIECAVRVRLTPERDPYLSDHVYKGTMLLPMVFGLEAMAQVALRAADLAPPDYVCIENIELARPVVVPATGGEDVIVHAEVLPEQGDGLVRVSAHLGARQTGFQTPHFAATFVFGGRPAAPEHYEIPRRAVPLRIDPVTDLYTRFLFHGPRFQVVKSIYELRSDYCVIEALHAPTPSGGELVLGDPYFRDALMQAGQVVIPQERGLPRRIKRLELRRTAFPSATVLLAEGTLNERTKEHIDCDITVVDADGHVVQRLTSCTFAIVEHLPDEPTAEDIAAPDGRDSDLVSAALAEAASQCDVQLPAIRLANLPGLHDEEPGTRHDRERPLVEWVAAEAARRAGEGNHLAATRIGWDDSGKPRLDDDPSIGVSLAHDRRYCVAVAGDGAQGVDIEEVTPRPPDESQGLVGPAHQGELARLAEQESLDRATARLWAAGEAVVKAHGLRCVRFAVARQSGESVLLDAELPGGEMVQVLTRPVLLSLGRERMVAVTVAPAVATPAPAAIDELPSEPATAFGQAGLMAAGYDAKWVGLSADTATRELLLRWPVTFREAANLGGTVRFTVLIDWMGKAREIAIMPIMKDLSEQLASGQWGMITNDSSIRVVGDARLGDVVETRFSIRSNEARPETTADLNLEWRRVSADGTTELLGEGRQSVTWVRVIGHGQVRPEPLPGYFRAFIASRTPRIVRTSNGSADARHARGACWWERPSGPLEGPLLEERDFETSLAESNIVGNIYFAQYYDWMARLLEDTWHRISPQTFTPGMLELPRCLEARMKHLVDAMPFARVRVRMSLSALYEQGATFAFNYFSVMNDGEVRKLARGELDYAWSAGEGREAQSEMGQWLRGMAAGDVFVTQ